MLGAPPPRVLQGMKYLILPTGSEGEEYSGLGVFLLQYLPLVKIWKQLHYNADKLIYLGSKNKNLRDRTQATILPLAIILTAALWALVSMTAEGRIVTLILPPLCLLYYYLYMHCTLTLIL